jgi:hypothetical protein
MMCKDELILWVSIFREAKESLKIIDGQQDRVPAQSSKYLFADKPLGAHTWFARPVDPASHLTLRSLATDP